MGLRKLDIKAYLNVPRDSETVTRSLIRIFQGGYRERPHEYISGDSFKSHCCLELKPDNWKKSLLALGEDVRSKHMVFIPGLPHSDTSFELVSFLESKGELNFPNMSLVFHNGDMFPEQARIEAISKKFNRIYAVNWTGHAENVHPIPIGLENEGLLRNGVVDDFLELLPKLRPVSQRPITLLAAFSTHTNSHERERALYFAKQFDRSIVLDKPVTPKKYRELITDSVYVLSPPGNGIDCHRTWEALFLGAIPVVKDIFWPFKNLSLNVVILKDWQDLKNLPSSPNLESANFLNEYGKVENWLNH